MLGVVAHDPRAAPPAPPARAYGPPPPHPSSPRMFYDPFHRREPEMPRSGVTPSYSYPPSSVPTSVPPVSYTHENAYAAYRTESNGYHTPASHVSLKEQSLPRGNRESEHRSDPHYPINHANKPERRMRHCQIPTRNPNFVPGSASQSGAVQAARLWRLIDFQPRKPRERYARSGLVRDARASLPKRD
ncbi:hypothetical protein AbraIFM66951_005755 [Aspergillus brasiliensis]|nr:hypothetical protein AbraIFM66951_005755 [Aspergillus brasiliensis]